MNKTTLRIEETYCEICNNSIEFGDECYSHGQGVYTCSEDCAKEFEGEKE